MAVVVGTDPDALLIIQRAERSGDPWSGHMGLPGGRRDKEDEHLLATAIRETQEEVGLALAPSDLLASLDDVAPGSSARPPIFARPYVFGVQGHPPLTPNHEVSRAFWVPVSVIADPDLYRSFSITLSGEAREFPAYHLEGGIVWGMTERLLTSFFSTILA